jgi:hypothetical protein
MPTTPTVYNAWRGGTNLTYISGGLYGFADPGTTVQIWNNGALFRTVTVPASGLWNTYGDPTPFPDGSYHVTAISVDAAGNKSAPSPVLSFLVDNTPPSAPTIVLDDPGAGAIVPARFSGTAEAGSAVTLSIGQTVIATAVADGTGHWRASAVLADGRFSITAVARDAAQNVSLAASTLDFVRTTADDFGNDVGHAGVIAVGGTAAGTVNYAGDSDWFKVSLDELTIYKFSLKGADAGGGTLPSVDGRPAAGLQLWDPQANDGKGAFFYLNPVFPVNGDLAGLASIGRSGDYYLIVNGSAPGTYTLGAVATAHDDYFGDWARATAISAGAQISGRFEHSSDVDTFKVMLTAGTTYVFELDGGADLAIPGNMRIEVMDGARTVGVYSDMNSMNQAVASLTPASSGEYFVSVSYSDYYYTGTGSYVLKVLTPPDDFGASVANSGKIAIGETVRGTNEVSGDRDWFEVTLQAGTAYTFAVDQGDLGSGLLYLHDATGARLNLYPQRYDHGNVLTWTPTTSGSYFVEVGSSGRPGPYILQARLGDVDDHGASPATAGQVNPGQFTSGRLEVPTDVDWYKVSLKANVFYSFRIDPTPEGLGGHLSGPNVSLVDASGRVQMGGMYDNGAGLINFQPTVDGDFYVTVSAFSQVFSYTISSSMNYDDRYLGSTATTGTLSRLQER